MKMSNLKRTIAGLLATVMVLGGALSVTAADPKTVSGNGSTTSSDSASGNGYAEGFLDKEVFKVVVPSVSADDLTFTMDPQGLLKVAGVSGANGAGDLLFLKAADPSKSGDITVKNKSSFPISVSLDVTVDSGKVALVSENAALADVTVPSIFMQVSDGTNNTTVSESTTTVTVSLDSVRYEIVLSDKATYEAAPATLKDHSVISGNSGNYYAYQPADPSDSNDVTFNISGATDTVADWSAVTNPASNIQIVWNIAKYEEAANTSITSGATASSETGVDFEMTFTKGSASTLTFAFAAPDTAISSVGVANTLSEAAVANTKVTKTADTVVVDGSYVSTQPSGTVRYIKVTCDGGTVIVVKMIVA